MNLTSIIDHEWEVFKQPTGTTAISLSLNDFEVDTLVKAIENWDNVDHIVMMTHYLLTEAQKDIKDYNESNQ